MTNDKISVLYNLLGKRYNIRQKTKNVTIEAICVRQLPLLLINRKNSGDYYQR